MRSHNLLTVLSLQRDYMWNLSRALMMAKESIYIHDWWLSPGMASRSENRVLRLTSIVELQLRRPHRDRYRLDNLLKRKASQGVKIYVIL